MSEWNGPAIKEFLRPVEDPELNLSLVDLGLVYEVLPEDEGKVLVKMTLTSPMCPAGPYIMDEIKKRGLEYPGAKEVNVEVVWEPKWDPKTMATEECKDKLGIW